MHQHPPITGHVRLEARKRGSDVWIARLRTVDARRDGSYGPTQRTIKLGPAHTGKGRPPAGHYTERIAADELVRLLDAERERVAGGRPTTVTFGQAADEWIRYSEDENGCAYSTMQDYRRTVKLLKAALGEDTPVTSITAQRVEHHKTAVKATGVSARTVNRHLVLLGGIFRRADARWATGHNPASGAAVKRLREQWSGAAIRFYRPEEVHALVAATPDPTFEAMFLTAALTGLRLGELIALRWRNVDLNAQSLHVERSFCQASHEEKSPKSGRTRTVPLAPEVQHVLARLRDVTGFEADDDLVFPAWDGGHTDYRQMTAMYKTAQQRAGLKPIRFHDLRHTFGTICAAAGIPLNVIQGYLGHAHISTTEIYAHFAPKGDEAALIGAAFAAATQPSPAPATA